MSDVTQEEGTVGQWTAAAQVEEQPSGTGRFSPRSEAPHGRIQLTKVGHIVIASALQSLSLLLLFHIIGQAIARIC